MGAYYYTDRDHLKAMPNVRFKDAELLVNWVRFVKCRRNRLYARSRGYHRTHDGARR